MYKIKRTSTKKRVKATRIEIVEAGRSKTIVLEHTNPSKLVDFLKSKMGGITETLTLEFSVTESPLRQTPKCRVQVFESLPDDHPTKGKFKSFTAYGMTVDKAHDTILDLLKESSAP